MRQCCFFQVTGNVLSVMFLPPNFSDYIYKDSFERVYQNNVWTLTYKCALFCKGLHVGHISLRTTDTPHHGRAMGVFWTCVGEDRLFHKCRYDVFEYSDITLTIKKMELNLSRPEYITTTLSAHFGHICVTLCHAPNNFGTCCTLIPILQITQIGCIVIRTICYYFILHCLVQMTQS